MSDVEWMENEEAEPKKKRRIPGWVLWGCGGGCLVALLVAGGLAIVGISVGKKIADPEYAKGKIANILPYDEWPEDYTARGGGLFGIEEYFITGPFEGVAVLIRMPSLSEVDKMLDPDSLQYLGTKDREEGTILLQSREVRCVRFRQVSQPSIRVDLSEGTSPYLCLQLTPGHGDEPIEDSVVQDFLAPFDLWRNR